MNFLDVLASFFTQPHIEWLILFALVSLIQIVYYLVFYLPIAKEKTRVTDRSFNQPVSVIIAAHNEAENLSRFLPSVLEQDYPVFEVIVVDDRSSDETETVLAIFKQKYPHLRTSFIKDTGKLKRGKKLALTLGIKAAQYDYLLLTDADCKPASNQWIKSMSSDFSKADVVLGYGPYFTQKGWLNKWIRYETSSIALQYMGYAKASVPYMGIGRNLAYKKQLFTEHKGFMTHAHLPSGDDDLFINEISSKANITYNVSPDSFVYSIPQSNWKNWKRQKQRHLSSFSRYRKKHLILLSLETYSRIGFYLLLPVVLMLFPFCYAVYLLTLIRVLLFVGIQIKWNKKMQEKNIAAYALVFDLISPIIYFFLYINGRKYQHK